jgi:RNA polymerase sigma factor (sigma-70 family)
MEGMHSPFDPDRLREAVATLRQNERRVLFLSAAEGLRNAEIAKRLGITPRAAERLLARALRKLDRALDDRPWWRFW